MQRTIDGHADQAGARAESTGFIAGIIAGLDRWKKARQVERELSMMTPRELADLGLTPGDIRDVARGTFRMPL